MNKKVNTYIVVLLVGIALTLSSFLTISSKDNLPVVIKPSEKVCVEDSSCFIEDKALFTENWDSLPQVLFWKKIMLLSPDSSIINVPSNRKVICTIEGKCYFELKDNQKLTFKDSLRNTNLLDSNSRLYVTTGKNHFYNFEKVMPSIAKAIPIFEKQGVDPWYAQAILLIECPGQLKKSSVGAYGSFQIMSKVARKFGLVVNKYTDERKDLTKSAYAASRLINEICIPYAKEILNSHNIPFTQEDVFFKLLVLHIYHAGAGNVKLAVNKLSPTKGGQDLIKGLWQTETARFKNASQNYSQVALAAMVIMHENQLNNKTK